MVGRVHGRVQRFRHGTPPEEMGGTKLDNNGMAALSTRLARRIWIHVRSTVTLHDTRYSVMRLVVISY
jgi:hypothetical protein